MELLADLALVDRVAKADPVDLQVYSPLYLYSLAHFAYNGVLCPICHIISQEHLDRDMDLQLDLMDRKVYYS